MKLKKPHNFKELTADCPFPLIYKASNSSAEGNRWYSQTSLSKELT